MIVFGADGDMSKFAARRRAVPVDNARRAVDDIAGMQDLRLLPFDLMIADAVRRNEDLSRLMAVPAVIRALGEDDIRLVWGFCFVRLSDYRTQIDRMIEI